MATDAEKGNVQPTHRPTGVWSNPRHEIYRQNWWYQSVFNFDPVQGFKTHIKLAYCVKLLDHSLSPRTVRARLKLSSEAWMGGCNAWKVDGSHLTWLLGCWDNRQTSWHVVLFCPPEQAYRHKKNGDAHCCPTLLNRAFELRLLVMFIIYICVIYIIFYSILLYYLFILYYIITYYIIFYHIKIYYIMLYHNTIHCIIITVIYIYIYLFACHLWSGMMIPTDHISHVRCSPRDATKRSISMGGGAASRVSPKNALW